VPLARAAENVEHVLRLASQRGVTHARIALNPAELGSIDVHLRHTSDGIVARVVAHSPEAVQQLQQAAADLRRSLEDKGLNLLNLDVGHSGDERSAGAAGHGFGDGGNRTSGGSGDAGETAGTGETTTTSTLQLPNGVLVDVLA
jgi:flagellar hook-length control protein FliK